MGDDDNATPGIDTRTITMDSGDTLVGALSDAGVSSDEANAAIAALAQGLQSARTARRPILRAELRQPTDAHPVAQITYTPPNQAAELTSQAADAAAPSPGKLLSMSFSPSIDHEITISRAADGTFSAQDMAKKLVAHYHRAGGTIDSSLYLAAMQAGIPAEVVVQMIHIFSYQVDFQRDIHPGDKFQVLYNYYYTADGKPAKQGDDRLRHDDARRARPTRSTAISRRIPIPPTISTAKAAAPRAC